MNPHKLKLYKKGVRAIKIKRILGVSVVLFCGLLTILFLLGLSYNFSLLKATRVIEDELQAGIEFVRSGTQVDATEEGRAVLMEAQDILRPRWLTWISGGPSVEISGEEIAIQVNIETSDEAHLDDDRTGNPDVQRHIKIMLGDEIESVSACIWVFDGPAEYATNEEEYTKSGYSR